MGITAVWTVMKEIATCKGVKRMIEIHKWASIGNPTFTPRIGKIQAPISYLPLSLSFSCIVLAAMEFRKHRWPFSTEPATPRCMGDITVPRH